MPAYPTYTVAGVEMDDPSGRWNLVPGTAVLPSFPGRRQTKVPTPGVPGYRAAAHAPGEHAVVPLVVRFNAIGDTANVIVSGGTDERTAAISRNMDLFFQATALARSGYEGMVEIKRLLSPADSRVANARIISSSDTSWSPYDDYAEVTFLYEIPSGVWLDPTNSVTRSTIQEAGKVIRLEVPTGTAPALANMIAIKGPIYANKSSGRIYVGNQYADGFMVGFTGVVVDIKASQWLVIDTQNWRCGVHEVNASDPDRVSWNVAKPYTWLDSTGMATGSALTILPSEKSGVGYVDVALQAPGRVQVFTRRAWY